MARSSISVLSFSCLLVFACSSTPVRYVSPYPLAWVKEQIAAYEMPANQKPSHVTRSVIFAGKRGYLIPSPCCDRFDFLYDSKGAILCAPSGGFGGRGDGSCPGVLADTAARAQGVEAGP